MTPSGSTDIAGVADENPIAGSWIETGRPDACVAWPSAEAAGGRGAGVPDEVTVRDEPAPAVACAAASVRIVVGTFGPAPIA